MRLKIRFSFFSFLLLLSLVISKNKFFYLSFLAVFIHELGHILAAKLLGIRLNELSIGMLGARIKTDGACCSYYSEAVLCSFGPLFNFSTALLVFIFCSLNGTYGEGARYFVNASLFLGGLNIMPIRTFDGGRILEALLLSLIPLEYVNAICGAISFIFIFSLWSASIYFLLIYSSSLGIFVFSFSLFCSMFVREER